MKKHAACVLLMFLAMVMNATTSSGQIKTDSETWSIAIHGGAGGNATNWDAKKKELRLVGMRKALSKGKEMLSSGASALGVVEAVITILEDDASFNAGKGSVLNQAGKAELDASIMNGANLACGAVAGVTVVKNPIQVARSVMEETPHVLLVSKGAEEFAKKSGAVQVDPSYFLSSVLRTRENRVDGNRTTAGEDKHYGTVGCVVRDQHGNLAAGTSTGGTSKKLAGRVGDSPLVGAGTYADNRFAAVSGTGIGEEYIRNAAAYDVIAQMRYASTSLEDAVDEMINNRLPDQSGGLIAVDRDGKIVMQHNTPSMSCGSASSDGLFEVRLDAFPARESVDKPQ